MYSDIYNDLVTELFSLEGKYDIYSSDYDLDVETFTDMPCLEGMPEFHSLVYMLKILYRVQTIISPMNLKE